MTEASGWLLHAAVWSDAATPADAPAHARVRGGALALLISPSRLADADDAAAEALRHDALLTAYAREGDVAPIRFGAAVAGPAAAAEALAERAPELEAALRGLCGAVEWSLRLVEREGQAVRTTAPQPSGDGRDWLRRRRDAGRAAEAGAAAKAAFAAEAAEHASAAARAVAHRRQPVAGRRRWLDMALLAPREGADALAATARTLAPRAEALGLALSLSGPFAPYSFVAMAEEAAA